jgi:hypothetical protein
MRLASEKGISAAPILVFSRGNAAIESDPLVLIWVVSQCALCSPDLKPLF